MIFLFSVTSIFVATSLSYAFGQEPQCQVENFDKVNCGYYGIRKHQCLAYGCCYDEDFTDEYLSVPVCYQRKVLYVETHPVVNHKMIKQGNIALPVSNPRDPIVVGFEPVTDAPPQALTTTKQPLKKKPGVTLLQVLQMQRNNISHDIINSLIADTVRYGALYYALKDGKLDYNEWLAVTKDPGITMNPVIARYLTGTSLNGILYSRLAKMFGINPTLVQLLMTKNNEPVVKHIAARLSAQSNLNPASSFVLTAMLTNGVSRDKVRSFMMDQALKDRTLFSREAVKALMSGNRQAALRWIYLAANERRIPLGYYYPKHEIAFAYLVDSQKLFPKKVQPSVIFALALNESINGIFNQNKTFREMFGVEANNYVCYSHQPSFRMQCGKLKNRLYPSSLECLDAGCCTAPSTDPNKEFTCFENVLGRIGVGLAQRVWDEDYIIKKIFGGKLPTLQNLYPKGIPWLPKKNIPDYSYIASVGKDQPGWLESMTVNGNFIMPRPTTKGTSKLHLSVTSKGKFIAKTPSNLRLNRAKWVPHGPTSFPTLMPDGAYPSVTNAPGIINGSSSARSPFQLPSIFQIPPLPSLPCQTVRKEDRRECMSNSAALLPSGKKNCLAMDCCYDPFWSNFTVPICFRTIDYGQCYNVPLRKRKDCGTKGITKEKCLSNPSCCYDSSITSKYLKKSVPWCYYKLHSFVDTRRCPLVATKKRVPCFPNEFNSIVSEETCKNVGCCFEKVQMSFFFMTLTKAKPPPSCYKLPVPALTPTDPPPRPPVVIPSNKTCSASMKLNPRTRKDCNAHGYFSCVFVHKCCYKREFLIPSAPWCFEKS